MAWIGPPGRLIEFKCPSAVSVTPADQRKIFTSLGGRVSITEPGPSAPYHVWRVAVSTATPQAVSLLRGLSLREWGVGPFYWVPPASEVTNLLSPSTSLCIAYLPQPTGAAQAGPMAVEDHFAGQSWAAGPEQWVMLGAAPVVQGKPVTLRAWCSGPAAQVRAVFRDATGTDLSTSVGPTVDATTPRWVHATFTTIPSAAASVSLRVYGISRATRPSITWTTEPRSWDVGDASMSVSVQPVPTTYVRATGAVGQERITDHEFEIIQVAS